MQSHERDGSFNCILADGATINTGSIGDEEDNRSRFQSPAECLDFVLAFATLEPLRKRNKVKTLGRRAFKVD
jgi:hypothetical protein